jgi:hypothetical protein
VAATETPAISQAELSRLLRDARHDARLFAAAEVNALRVRVAALEGLLNVPAQPASVLDRHAARMAAQLNPEQDQEGNA